MSRYLRRKIPDDEVEARDRIFRVLEELRAADDIGQGTTMSEFRQVVEESLRAPVGHLGITGKGVFVSTFATAAGMDFDAAWMVGMIEGAAPPQIHDDPLLPGAIWREAGGPSRYGQRIAKERYDYLSAVASAGSRTLSYPVADPESRRKAFSLALATGAGRDAFIRSGRGGRAGRNGVRRRSPQISGASVAHRRPIAGELASRHRNPGRLPRL